MPISTITPEFASLKRAYNDYAQVSWLVGAEDENLNPEQVSLRRLMLAVRMDGELSAGEDSLYHSSMHRQWRHDYLTLEGDVYPLTLNFSASGDDKSHRAVFRLTLTSGDKDVEVGTDSRCGGLFIPSERTVAVATTPTEVFNPSALQPLFADVNRIRLALTARVNQALFAESYRL